MGYSAIACVVLIGCCVKKEQVSQYVVTFPEDKKWVKVPGGSYLVRVGCDVDTSDNTFYLSMIKPKEQISTVYDFSEFKAPSISMPGESAQRKFRDRFGAKPRVHVLHYIDHA